MELPAELKWLEWVVGSDWPEGDEDALWRMKAAWQAAGHDVRSLLEDGNAAYYRLLASVGGSLEESFTEYWQRYSDGDEAYLTKLAQLCDNLAQHCDDTALQIEYAKYQFIVALIILAIQIAYMLAMAAPTFGASTAAIPVAEVATQSFIRIIAQNIIRTMIFMIVQNVLSDAVVQAVQIGEGHRAHFDGSKTVQAAIDGAISGAVFGAAGGAVHLGGAKFAPNLSKTVLGKLGEGAAINVAGSLGMAAVTGQDLSFDNLAKTATAGVAMSTGGLREHGGGHPTGHESDPLTLDGPHDQPDLLAGGTRTEVTAFDPGHPAPDDRGGAPRVDAPASSGGDRILSALSGEPDPVRTDPAPYHDSSYGVDPSPVAAGHDAVPAVDPVTHAGTDPVAHGGTDPVVHDVADPVHGGTDPMVHSVADPVTHTGADPVAHSATDPVAHGATDPVAHGATDPVGHSGPADGTRLAGAQSTGVLDAPAMPGPRPVDVPPDPTQRSSPANAPAGGFVAPVAGPVPDIREGAPTAPASRGDTATVPRPGTGPGGFGTEPPADAGHVAVPGDAPPLPRPEDAFADRGTHPDDVAWSGEGRALDPVQNAAADRFLAHAYQAEAEITPRIRALAHDLGGQLYGEEYARKSEDSFKRKLADEIAEYPRKSLDGHLANMKDAVRYTIALDGEHYADGAQRVVDHLLGARDEQGQPRYEPVKFKNFWGNDEGYVGINSFWLDHVTGQVFELQIHTPESFAAKMETHGHYEVARTTADPLVKEANHAAANARFAQVPRPSGITGIHVPDEAWPGGRPPQPGHEPTPPEHGQPTSGTPPDLVDRGDEHEPPPPDQPGPYPPVTDEQAVDLAREHLHPTASGYAFYPDGDHVLPFADAVRPRDGVVNLDLHGTRDGFLVDGRILTGEQFAHAIDVLRQEGRLHIEPGDRIRLGSCDVGQGEDPPAQRFARASGLEVVAPTERLWTNLRGEEIVSSAQLRDGRWVPGLPPDGHWRAFSPEHEVPGGSGGEPELAPEGVEPRGSEHDPTTATGGEPWHIPEFPRTLPDDHPLLRPTHEIDTPERQEFRRDLVTDIIGDAQPAQGRPVLHLMGGGGASGKGAVLEGLVADGVVPQDGVVHLDPDALKTRIPEYAQIVQAGDSRAAAVVHEESSALAKAILGEAMDRRLSLVYDVTLGDPRKAVDLIRRARDAGYEVRLYGVSADPDVAVERNASRAARTGRYVPVEMQLHAHQGFSAGFERYAALVDQAVLFDTNGSVPVVMAVKEPGHELAVVDPERYTSFLHKADLDPHAQGPGDLYADRAPHHHTSATEHTHESAHDADRMPQPGSAPDPSTYPIPDAIVDQPDLPSDPAAEPVRYGVPADPQGDPIPLFGGQPTRDQAQQGALNDCGVAATIGAVAGHRPDLISSLIRARPDGTFEVTFHEVAEVGQDTYRPTGQVVHLAVSPDVPVLLNDRSTAAYLDQNQVGTSWASMVEKAVAGVDETWDPQRAAQNTGGFTGYDRLDQGSNAWDRAELLAQLTGQPAEVRYFDKVPGHEAGVERELRAQLDAHKPVLVGVPEPSGPNPQPLPHGLHGDHVYEVVRVDNGRVELRNPWNIDHPTPMSVREFLDLTRPVYTTLE